MRRVRRSGGEGGRELAEAVVAAARPAQRFPASSIRWTCSIKDKIETIATKIYGADGVDYLPEAEAKIKLYTRPGLRQAADLHGQDAPVALARSGAQGRAHAGFRVPMRDIRASVGAGFLYPLLGEMRTMPGLPSQPAGNKIDLTPDGKIVGLF